jgi:hypothetical protein
MSQTKEKVAVLISGSMRNFHSVYISNMQVLKKLELDCVFFIHTWTNNFDTHKDLFTANGNTLLFPGSPYKYGENLVNVKEIINQLPNNWLVNTEDFLNFKNNSLLTSNNLEITQNLTNSLAMYYGMKQVASMARNSNIDFKYYLRLRPDFLLPKKLKFSTKYSLVFHGPGVSIFGKEISDQCFSGVYNESFESMFVYDNLEKKLILNGLIDPISGLSLSGENALYLHLKDKHLLISCQNKSLRRKGKIIRNIKTRDFEISFVNFNKLVYRHNKKVFSKRFLKFLVYFYHNYRKFLGL